MDMVTITRRQYESDIAEAKAEALRELSNRLFRADVELSRMKHQTERISGKAEGVRLAQSYVDETVREIEAPR
jgi:signal recognition particle GTPase